MLNSAGRDCTSKNLHDDVREDVSSLVCSRHSGWLISGVLVAVQIPPSLGGCSTGRLLHFCLETSSRSLRVEVVSACLYPQSLFFYSSSLSSSCSFLWFFFFFSFLNSFEHDELKTYVKLLLRRYKQRWGARDTVIKHLCYYSITFNAILPK